jgi:hypothetical protein
MDKLPLTVIVPTFNRKDVLAKSLAALFKQTLPAANTRSSSSTTAHVMEPNPWSTPWLAKYRLLCDISSKRTKGQGRPEMSG